MEYHRDARTDPASRSSYASRWSTKPSTRRNGRTGGCASGGSPRSAGRTADGNLGDREALVNAFFDGDSETDSPFIKLKPDIEAEDVETAPDTVFRYTPDNEVTTVEMIQAQRNVSVARGPSSSNR